MRYILLSVILMSCACRSTGGRSAGQDQWDGISISELLSNKERYIDKEVVLDAVFVRHIEGPWLCDDYEKVLDPALTITNHSNATYYLKAGEESIFEGFEDVESGESIYVMGIFRVRDYPLRGIGSGMTAKNHPYLEVKAIRKQNDSSRMDPK